MSDDSRAVDFSSALGNSGLEEFGDSWPSKNNCTSADRDGEDGDFELRDSSWWQQKNDIVREFIVERPDRAARPISVRGDQKLREECTIERHDGGLRAKTWSSVMNEFLDWYNGYRHSHLVFSDPDGNVVRAPMPNSHQPSYGNKYYARLKSLERQMMSQYDELHIAMLTFTGSMKNANGGWRCPSDHLRDVVDSWRPSRGRGVYHALRDSLNGKEWEYAIVLEKHKNGYGHVHCAIFVDGVVTESDFHPAIDAHIRQCEIAHRDAHDYYSSDVSNRPISIRSVAPQLDQVSLDETQHEVVANIGSYIGEYIGAYGKPLFDREIDELQFRAAVWATGTRLVRFSKGANEMIRSEFESQDRGSDESLSNSDSEENADYSDNLQCNEVESSDWSLEAIGRVDRSGEELYPVKSSTVKFRLIEDAQKLDPPNSQPDTPPEPIEIQSTLDKSV